MSQITDALSAAAILEWIVARLAALQGLARDTIEVRERFSRYGLDSQGATSLLSDLAQTLKRPLSPTLVWEYPTPEALARHLAGGAADARSEAPQTTLPPSDEPIAIIGLSCRLPKAQSPAAFWELLCHGVDAITEVPRERWDARALFDPDLLAPGKMNTRWGGFIDQVDRFDPLFFGISPREAVLMDPQQRLMLELSWEALEDASLVAAELKGSRTGVFFGVAWTDYARLLHQGGLAALTQHTVTGFHHSIIANRVSYVLGLQGPSVAIDTACSSSLVAVHLACESLRRGESTTALAGGVNLTLIPESTLGVSKFGGLSSKGRCFAFDARADGYVRGEGGGVVVLKPLSRALADGDPIYCLIRGSAVNNDGASNGLTAPNPAAQEAVLRAAYARAGIDPASVDYVEAHGTGTQLGDPIEAKALGTILGTGRPPERPLLLGSVKTNIGHLEPASGVAGIIKVALAMKHGQIPPSLHFEKPNPHIPFAELRLQMQTILDAWPSRSAPATAGVSAFGFGGTNCHVVLQAVAAPPAAHLPLSPGFAARVQAPEGRVQPVFIFSGQGSQWAGMGMRLMRQEPVFRALMERCDALIREHLGWSLLTELTLSKDRSRMDQIDVTCPAIVTMEIALAALWRSWGVEPALVIGHSIGEVAAAQVAGVLSLEEAMLVICTQGRLLRRLRGRGTMGLIALPWQQACEALTGYTGRLWPAIHESPDSTVISGESESIATLFATLERQKVFCRRINVDVAAHSAQVDGIRAELREALAGLTPCRADVPMISSVTGTFLDGDRFTAEHWVKNLGEPVLFAEAMRTAAKAGLEPFLEVSPHPLLQRALKSCLSHSDREAAILSSLRRDEDERAVLLDTAKTFHVLGQPMRWEEICSAGGSALAESTYALPLSAHSPEALIALADAHLARLEKADGPVRIGELAFSLSVRRNHHKHRLAVIASTPGELREALAAFRAGREHKALVQGQAALGAPPKVVFVFPGQGSQWLGMGRELLREEPAFRRALKVCDQAIQREAGFSIVDAISGGNGAVPLDSIDRMQPVLFAMEVALAALFRAWGIRPDAVIGHSMGEVAAAHVSGALSLADAAQIICRRSRLLRRVSGQGAMALVELSLEEAARELQDYRDRLSVAVSNGPRSTVIAGDPSALQAVLQRCAEKGIFCRRVKVDVASHSPQVDLLLGELHAALQGIKPMAPQLPMLSTVTGKTVTLAELDAAYWVQNLRAPVLFAQTIEQLIRSGHLLFLEISPHPILLPAISEALHRCGRDGLTLPSLRREQAERQGMLHALSALYTHGHDIEWTRLHPRGGRRLALPSYPWQRERLWVEASQHAAASPLAGAAAGRLLGSHLASSVQAGLHFWERALSGNAVPSLLDHRLRGEAVLPGAAYVNMALTAATEVYGAGPMTLSQLVFERMLLVPEAEGRAVQLVLAKQEPGRASLQISSREDRAWVRHASMNLERGADAGQPSAVVKLQQVQNRCPRWMSGAEHYQRLDAAGLWFGPSFKSVEQLWFGDGEVVARVRLPDYVQSLQHGDVLPPPLLDACFQAVAAVLAEAGPTAGDSTLILTAVQELRLHRPSVGAGWVHAAVDRRVGNQAEFTGELTLLDDDGHLLLAAKGVRMRRHVPPTLAAPDPAAQWLYNVQWQQAPLDPELPPQPRSGVWLLLSDRSSVGAALASQLQARGQRCVRFFIGTRNRRSAPDTYELDSQDGGALRAMLVQACGEVPPQAVVHLWSLEVLTTRALSPASLESDLWLGTLSALHLAQAMLAMGWRQVPPLTLVTRGAQAVGSARAEHAALPAIVQAPLWGLGRTLTLEHPELRCRCIDLDSAEGTEDVLPLLRELELRDGPTHVALRTEGRYVGRLSRAPLTRNEERSRAQDRGLAVQSECAYLVCGGSNGPGLWAAEWLVAHGARRLLLLDRADVAADLARLARLGEAGAEVVVTQAETLGPVEIAGALSKLDKHALPLRGVLYADIPPASEHPILALRSEHLRMALERTLRCIWSLHTQTATYPLDFFVLFASCAAMLGPPGQANTAAMGALLSALAEQRRAEGRCGLGILWGALEEPAPAAAQHGELAPGAYRGIEALSPSEGMAVMDWLLGEQLSTAAVMKLNLRHFVQFHPAAIGSSLFDDLRRTEESKSPGLADTSRWRARLRNSRPEERASLLEKLICGQLGQTLRQDPGSIPHQAPFRALGLDSVMAMELRNRLESHLELQLSAALLFTYANVSALAAYVLSALGLCELPSVQAVAPARHDAPWTALDTEVNAMSDTEAEAALLAKLQALQ